MTDKKKFYSDTLDAAAKNRANHTGTQAIATVSGLQTALDGAAVVGNSYITWINTGTRYGAIT